MIISKEVEDIISIHNINYYNSNGYDVKLKEILVIDLCLISPKSNPIIEAKCDKCNSLVKIKHKSYLKNKSNYYFSCSSKCSSDKSKKTSLKRYGVEVPSQLERIKNNMKATCLERYGVEWSFQSEEMKSKYKKTCLERYGVEYVSQTDCFKEKVKKTNKLKYGSEHFFNSDFFQHKYKKIMLQKYGVDSPLKSESIRKKWKNTMLQRYGVDNPLKSEKIYEKYKNTIIKKYGVEYLMQNKEIFNKQQKSAFARHKYKESNLHYQGTYELDFLEKCSNMLEIENGPTIKYDYDSKKRIYYPDFYLPKYNLIVEIKSSWTYNMHLDINLKKEKECIKKGFNFIFVIDKNYDNLNKIIY